MGSKRWMQWAAWGLLAVGLVAAFARNFAEMWLRWFPAWPQRNLSLYDRLIEGESYYTHAPLVPLIALVIAVLLIRHTEIPVRPARRFGLALLVGSLGVHLLSCLARVNFASGFAFIGVLAGLVAMLWGVAALKRFAFPLALLFFMVPLPEVTIADLNFRLKMIAADSGVLLANLVGVIAEQKGNSVFIYPDKSLVVANICNGLRTLISLIAFGALYAYVCKLRGLWRIGLFFMSVPVAVVSNAIRIAGLIVVADIWNERAATGWFHDVSGLMIYALAFMQMFGIERLVLWARAAVGHPAVVEPLFHSVRRPDDADDPWHQLHQTLKVAPVKTAAVLVLLTAAGAIHLNRSVPPVWDAESVRGLLPERMTVDGVAWSSYELELSRVELMVLETEDYFFRKYIDPEREGRSIDFCVIYSKDNRKGTHPPDLCIEGGGNQIFSKRNMTVATADGREIPARELLVRVQRPGGGGEAVFIFLYTFKSGDIYTSSFWIQQFVIFRNGLLNRDAGGALVRVSTRVASASAEDLAEGRRWTQEFFGAGIPYLDALSAGD